MEKKTLSFPEPMANALEDESDRTGRSQAEIVRDVLSSELEV